MAEQHWVNPPEEFTRKGSDDRKDSFDNVHNQPKKQKRKLAHLQGHFYANVNNLFSIYIIYIYIYIFPYYI